MQLERRKLGPLASLELAPGGDGRGARHGGGTLARELGRVRRGVSGLAAVLGAMVGRRQRSPLVLELTDVTLTFNDVAAFDFALASRAEYAAASVTDLLQRPVVDLERVAEHIRDVEQHFADMLSESLHYPGLIGELMREAETKLFSKDHDWRDIVEALNLTGPEFDDYKQIALVQYMRYLSSRQQVLRALIEDRKGAERKVPRRRDATVRGAGAAKERSAPDPGGNEGEPDVQDETAVFRRVTPGAITRSPASGGFSTLPHGRPVVLQIDRGEELELMLSGHRFVLRAEPEPTLVDARGTTHALYPDRKNIVGRQSDSDVVVDNSHREVSRRHLVVQLLPPGRIALTDLSANGTAVPAHVLPREDA